MMPLHCSSIMASAIRCRCVWPSSAISSTAAACIRRSLQPLLAAALVFGLKTGGYLVNEDLCHALVDDDLSQPHASNLGGLLAREIAAPLGIPAYIYDAVTSGELTDVAKITGFVDIERRSFCHVLNSRAMALRYAREHGKHYEELNLIVAHLGGGISASVHRHGEIIDSVGDDDGQFSPERSGCVPRSGSSSSAIPANIPMRKCGKRSAAAAACMPTSHERLPRHRADDPRR